MKQESETRPIKGYEIENIKDNKCDVVFFDTQNIQEETRINESGEEVTIFKYWLYRIKTAYFNELSTEIDNNYTEWFNRAKSVDFDAKAKEIREIRNKLLAESDKELTLDRLGLTIPDIITAVTLLTTVKNVFNGLRNMINGNWARYRQDLRDIPNQPGFPYDVEFPKKPE